MQGYGSDEPVTANPVREPEAPSSTEEELLEREERRAWSELRHAFRGVGDEFLETAHLRARVEEHPLLATAICATAGFVSVRPLAWIARRLGVLGIVEALKAFGLSSGLGLARKLAKGTPHRQPLGPF